TADLPERLRGRLLDLPAGLLEPPLPILVDLLAHAFLLRRRDLARLGEDRLSLAACVGDELPVLLEQTARLVARLVGLLDGAADAVPPVVDQLLDRTERIALEDPERQREADDRPDHQPRDDLDQRV